MKFKKFFVAFLVILICSPLFSQTNDKVWGIKKGLGFGGGPLNSKMSKPLPEDWKEYYWPWWQSDSDNLTSFEDNVSDIDFYLYSNINLIVTKKLTFGVSAKYGLFDIFGEWHLKIIKADWWDDVYLQTITLQGKKYIPRLGFFTKFPVKKSIDIVFLSEFKKYKILLMDYEGIDVMGGINKSRVRQTKKLFDIMAQRYEIGITDNFMVYIGLYYQIYGPVADAFGINTMFLF